MKQLAIRHSKAPHLGERAFPRLMIAPTLLVLIIIGALNWALVGIFQFDVVAWLFGGQGAVVSRIIYTIIGIAGLWCISLLFRDHAAA